MGKRRKKITTLKSSKSTNAINWEFRARELVNAGICSPLILDHRSPPREKK